MTTANITLELYDGARRRFDPSIQVFVKARDGHQQQQHNEYYNANSITFPVPFYNNPGDKYAVMASASGHADAGFYPVRVTPQVDQPVRLMLLPKNGRPNFDDATWGKLRNNYSDLHGLLARGVTDAEGEARYAKFAADAPGSLAAFFNITTAMRDITLSRGVALDYLIELDWNPDLMQQDRFYAYADARLVNEVVLAAQQGKFAPQSLLGLTHKGATSSYKHKQFGEANVQISFHEKEKKKLTVGDVELECVKVELDMDYFKNQVAHVVLEGIGNEITRGDTDPRKIYVLRWIAGWRAGVPEFKPPYTIVPQTA